MLSGCLDQSNKYHQTKKLEDKSGLRTQIALLLYLVDCNEYK